MKKVDISHAGAGPTPPPRLPPPTKRLQTSRVLGERKKPDYTGHFPGLTRAAAAALHLGIRNNTVWLRKKKKKEKRKRRRKKMKADPAEVCNDGERYIWLPLPCRGLIK